MKRPHLGAGSLLLFMLWTLLSVAALPDNKVWLLLAVVLFFTVFNDRGGLKMLARPRIWIFCLSILALSPFVLGRPDYSWGVIHLSREGLQTGLWMMLRALTIMLALGAVLGSLTVSELINLFERANLRGMGFALGVAFNLIGVLQDVVSDAYHTIRLRGGFRRPAANIPLLMVTIITNALRYGDYVVYAALARGFDPSGGPAGVQLPRLGLGRLDRVFLAGLVTASAGFILVG